MTTKNLLWALTIDGCVTYHVSCPEMGEVRALVKGAGESLDDAREVTIELYEDDTLTVGAEVDYIDAHRGTPGVVLVGGEDAQPARTVHGCGCEHCEFQWILPNGAEYPLSCKCLHCIENNNGAPREVTATKAVPPHAVRAPVSHWTRERGVVCCSEWP
ncbi:MAG: hypothetical protein ACPGVG_16005 [Mycobacterium sp.]